MTSKVAKPLEDVFMSISEGPRLGNTAEFNMQIIISEKKFKFKFQQRRDKKTF
jgi:hypothetical protein